MTSHDLIGQCEITAQQFKDSSRLELEVLLVCEFDPSDDELIAADQSKKDLEKELQAFRHSEH